MWSGTFGSKGIKAVVQPQGITISMMRFPDKRMTATATVNGALLTAQNRNVGDLQRVLSIDQHGVLKVTHSRMFLHKDAQNTGFATALNTHAEDVYRAANVRDIKLQAVQVGGYAWARAGFELAVGSGTPEQQLFRRASAATRMVERAFNDQRITTAEYEALLPRLLAPATTPTKTTLSSTQHFLELGELGKRILMGSNWDGVKHLSPA
jgi:hypothetical protein